MPNLTVKTLLALADPYQDFIANKKVFADNAFLLEQLSKKEKISLISTIIINCPTNKLAALPTIKSIQPLANSNDFHTMLFDAAHIATTIYSMSDNNTSEPYAMFVDNQFEPAIFHQFASISNRLADENGVNLACNLALKTPNDKVKSLTRNIKCTFSGHFPQLLAKALVLNRLLTNLINDKPGEVFEGRDFSIELFKQFHPLTANYLNSSTKAVKIGRQLAVQSDVNLQSLITERLNELIVNLPLLTAFFSSIRDEFNDKKNTKPCTAVTLHGVFSAPKTTNHNATSSEVLALGHQAHV